MYDSMIKHKITIQKKHALPFQFTKEICRVSKITRSRIDSKSELVRESESRSK